MATILLPTHSDMPVFWSGEGVYSLSKTSVGVAWLKQSDYESIAYALRHGEDVKWLEEIDLTPCLSGKRVIFDVVNTDTRQHIRQLTVKVEDGAWLVTRAQEIASAQLLPGESIDSHVTILPVF